jgi:chlorobactene glucosyltransferase
MVWFLLSLLCSAILTLVFYRAIAMACARVALKPRPWNEPYASADPPLVSVIVPARDEEENIAPCIRSLVCQDYPHLEIIVVDDNSTDATPHILEQLCRHIPHLRAVPGRHLPRGWTGKNYALFQGVRAAKGDWLLFTDADTRHHPYTISTALAHALSAHLDFLSLTPRQEAAGFWERIFWPMLIGCSAPATNGFARPRRAREARAHGAFILTRRIAYEKAGGHLQVRQMVLEDDALAGVVWEAGFTTQLAAGEDLFTVRMFRSLGEIWRGYGKNLFQSLSGRPSGSPRVLTTFLVTLLGGCLFPFALFAAECWWLAHRLVPASSYLFACALALTAFDLFLTLVYFGSISYGLRCPPWYAFTTPLGGLLLLAIFARSVYGVWGGRPVSWKGRSYPLAEQEPELLAPPGKGRR